MTILGIETSCDETSAAVVRNGRILSNLVASQDDVHLPYGGVVPELASRRHLENIIPIVSGALKEASCSIADIDGIAVTSCPGLVGSLLVGLSMAKGIAITRGLPFIGVNHLEGHVNAAHLEHDDIPYPHIALIVSGGHTSLYDVQSFGCYRLLGATRDDAAGEAFDKVGKLLGLGFPGGPAIDHIANQGNQKAFRFTAPKFENEDSLDFSFSGIKTAVSLAYKKMRKDTGGAACSEPLPSDYRISHSLRVRSHQRPAEITDLAASFQHTVVTFLTDRLFAAVKKWNARAVVVSGGVAANRELRRRIKERAEESGLKAYIPSPKLCTDNAAMIAYVGEKYLERGIHSDFFLDAIANQEIGI